MLSAGSQVAATLGLGERYRYWHGASGTAYLFTEIGRPEIADYSEAVLLALEPAAQPRVFVVEQRRSVSGGALWPPSWLTPTGGEPPRIGPHGRIFVHLLAATPRARRLVADDLRAAA